MSIIFFTLTIIITIVISQCTRDIGWDGYTTIKDSVKHVYNFEKGLWGNTREMKFNKLWEVGGREDSVLMFYQIANIETDAHNNIYVVDNGEHCIKVISENGALLRTIGAEGQGPGELYYPRAISINNNGDIYIHQTINNKISIFSDDGIFKEFYKFKGSKVTNIGHNPNGDLYITCNNFSIVGADHDSLFHIIRYNSTGGSDLQFGKQIFRGTIMKIRNVYSYPFARYDCVHDRVLLAYDYPYKISIFSNDGILKMSINNKTQRFVPPILLPDKLYFATQTHLSAVHSFPNGCILVIWRDEGDSYADEVFKQSQSFKQGATYKISYKEQKTFYDLYNSDGQLLQRFEKSPDSSDILAIDKAGCVYMNAIDVNENPVLQKYEVSFIEKTL